MIEFSETLEMVKNVAQAIALVAEILLYFFLPYKRTLKAPRQVSSP